MRPRDQGLQTELDVSRNDPTWNSGLPARAEIAQIAAWERRVDSDGSSRREWVYLREINCDGTVAVTPGTDASASTTGAEPLGVSRRRATAETDDIDGIGSTDADPFVGVDLDDCREPESGAADDIARDVVARLYSSTGVSPPGPASTSGASLQDERDRRGRVECDESARFVTGTGRRLTHPVAD